MTALTKATQPQAFGPQHQDLERCGKRELFGLIRSCLRSAPGEQEAQRKHVSTASKSLEQINSNAPCNSGPINSTLWERGSMHMTSQNGNKLLGPGTTCAMRTHLNCQATRTLVNNDAM
eukprot:2561211-Alexandrium_andersonii.AAC.2